MSLCVFVIELVLFLIFVVFWPGRLAEGGRGMCGSFKSLTQAALVVCPAFRAGHDCISE
jgi:hypothetical protein